MTHFQRVQCSLAMWCRYLDRPGIAKKIVFALLLTHTGLLAYSAYVHSPTLNEPGHLVAGLSHWKFGRFELYRVNPPLVRMIAALPVIVAGYEEDWSGFFEGPGARPVFRMGKGFATANGERTFFLFMIARWACIPLSWLGAIICYLWARDLSGKPAGVMACALWCFSPNILAHASLITADAGGTALGVAACYTFWRWLTKPTWTQAALTGGVLGLAELAKTTLILFYPLWPLLWIAYRWPDRREMCRQDWLREAGMLILRMAVGLYVLNLGYAFEGSLRPVKEFHFVSNLLTGQESRDERQNPHDAKTSARQPVPSASPTNCFADTWLGNLPVPFPKNYLLGIDIQQRDFEDYPRPSYLRGQWRNRGWWYYYLYAALIKIPLGTWMLAGLVIAWRITTNRSLKSGQLNPSAGVQIPAWRDELLLVAPPLVVFCVVSSKTGFCEHFRYVLPCFPFLFVWIGTFTPSELGTRINLLDKPGRSVTTNQRVVVNYTPKLLSSSATLIFLLWTVASSLSVYPHSLSYFNESIGGPLNGAKHLLGSNVDWGQDLRYSSRLSVTQEPLYCAFFGAYRPSAVGFTKWLDWPGRRRQSKGRNGNAAILKNEGAELPRSGIYLISDNFVLGDPLPVRDTHGQIIRLEIESVLSTSGCEEMDRVGYSMRAFSISPTIEEKEPRTENDTAE